VPIANYKRDTQQQIAYLLPVDTTAGNPVPATEENPENKTRHA
jgi:hypothetical protein